MSAEKEMLLDVGASQEQLRTTVSGTILASDKTNVINIAQKNGNDDVFASSARLYARAGLKVIPLRPRSKAPVIMGWPRIAEVITDDTPQWCKDYPTIVTQWREEHPKGNIGMVPAQLPDNRWVIVIDIDPRNDGDDTFARLINDIGIDITEITDTLTVYSGRGDGGKHLYFSVPADIYKNVRKDALGEGIDVIAGNGAQVLLPPSIHPEKGLPYTFDDDTADIIALVGIFPTERIKPAPEALIAKLRSTLASEPVTATKARLDDDAPALWVTDATKADLQSALTHISADDYHDWVRIGMALRELDDDGFALWNEWSRSSDKYDETKCKKKWNDFASTAELTHKTVFHLAEELGWDNPLRHSNASVETNFKDLDSRIVHYDDSDDVFDEHPHIVDSILPCGEVTLLAGHGGSGKSYISLGLAVHVAMGLPFGSLNVQQSKVLFVSAEDSGRTLKRRLAKLCDKLRINRKDVEANLLLLNLSGDDAALQRKDGKGSKETELFAELRALIDKRNVGLIIIDNASDTFDDEENSRAPVRKFIRSLRGLVTDSSGEYLNRALLLLTHVNKASANTRGNVSSEDYSGSSAWHNSARSRLSLARGDSEDCSVLTHSKANYGALTAPISVLWDAGVPLPKGAHTAVLEKQIAARASEVLKADMDKVYSVLMQCETTSQLCPCATTGQYSAYKHLLALPEFPQHLNSGDTNRILDNLARDGKIHAENYKNSDSKERRRWRCSPTDEATEDLI